MAEPAAGTGSYSIARRPGEVERLALQSAVLAAETEHLLDRIGVGAGWDCLDLGCGPGGITRPLSARVGPTGTVTGLDFDPAFVAIAAEGAAANTRFLQGNAYDTGLPHGSFDLVHMRFIASTAGEPERLVAEARRLVRPGGFVAAQEADFATLSCFPPHPAWTRLVTAYRACFPWTAEDPEAHRIYRLLRAAGLVEVGYRPVLVGTATAAMQLSVDEPFDVVIADLVLPDQSGISVARELSQRWPRMKTILMSGYSNDEIQHEIAGTSLLVKPFDMMELANALRSVLAA